MAKYRTITISESTLHTLEFYKNAGESWTEFLERMMLKDENRTIPNILIQENETLKKTVSSQNTDIQTLKTQLEDANKEIDRLKKQLENTPDVTSLSQDRDRLAKQVDEIQKQLQNTLKELEDANKERASLEAKNTELDDQDTLIRKLNLHFPCHKMDKKVSFLAVCAPRLDRGECNDCYVSKYCQAEKLTNENPLDQATNRKASEPRQESSQQMTF
jgi:DNA repair ATPase RecN